MLSYIPGIIVLLLIFFGVKEAKNSELKETEPQIAIVAVEQHRKSIPLVRFRPKFPLAIIVGNESYGISAGTLALSDKIVELPMFGINKSLNVMVCLGIVLYKTIDYLPQNK